MKSRIDEHDLYTIKESSSAAWSRYFDRYMRNLKDAVDFVEAKSDLNQYGDIEQVRGRIRIEKRLPFRFRRIERNNANGGEKQIRQRARYAYHNEYGRWKTRQHVMEKYLAIKELVDSGEATKAELMPRRFQLAEKRATEKGTTIEEEVMKLSMRKYDRTGEMKMVWSDIETKRMIELVKEHGRDFKKIEAGFNGTKLLKHIMSKITAIKIKMEKRTEGDQFRDEEFLEKINSNKSERALIEQSRSITPKIIVLVKEHGKDIGRITEALEGEMTREQVTKKIHSVAHYMRKNPQLADPEYLANFRAPTEKRTERLIALVKIHGRDFAKIAEIFCQEGDEKTRKQIRQQIKNIKIQMKKKPEL